METEPSVAARNSQEHVAPSETASPASPEEIQLIEEQPNNTNWGTDLPRLLDEARAKAESYWNDLLRVRAETDNLRRRAERDVENAHKFALERFVTELLPVKDSLELGLAATTNDVTKLREGMDLTLKMLTSAISKFGVAEINPLNERFNPELHQAMTVQPSAAVPPNTVLTVYQKGYTLNDRLVRPALVIVSQVMPSPANNPVTKIDVQA